MTTKHVRVWSEMRQNKVNGWALEHIKRAVNLKGPQGPHQEKKDLPQKKIKIIKYRAGIS